MAKTNRSRRGRVHVRTPNVVPRGRTRPAGSSRVGRPGRRAAHHRHSHRHGQGRAGRRRPRRHRHADQRGAKAPSCRRLSPAPAATSSSPTSRRTPTPSRSRWTASRPLKRSGVSVSAGDRVGVGTLTIEVGGADRDGQRQGRGAAGPGAERRALVHRRHRGGREPADLPTAASSSLAALAPGVTGTDDRVGDRSSTGGGNNNIMMDGVSTMDTGSNSVLLQMNVESIAEVKVLVSNYQAEYGRSSGLQITRRDQERHQPVPRLASTTSSATRTGTPTAGPTSSTAIRRPMLKRARLGLLDRRSGRQAGRQQQAVLLLRARVRAAHRRRRRRCASACRPRSSARATSRRSTDNNGNPFPYIKDPLLCRAPARRPTPRLLPADGGVLGRIPADRLYQTGLNILKLYPLPNIDVRRRQPTTTRSPGRRRSLRAQAAGRPRSTTSRCSSCAAPSSTPAGRSRTMQIPGIDSRLQRHAACTTRSCALLAATVNYTLNPTTFLEGTYGRSPELAGRLRAGAGRHRAEVLPQRASRSNDIANRQQRRPRRPADALPGRQRHRSRATSPTRRCNGVSPPIWDGTRVLLPPSFAWGSAASPTRRRTSPSPAS